MTRPQRSGERGAARAHPRGPQRNRPLYWAARALVHPAVALLHRPRTTGRAHIPRRGALILAANHRSVLDPIFVALLTRRPVYYMAKQELFRPRLQGWLLRALGGFPVDRRGGDPGAIDTANRILRRGDCLVIFPEGRCMPPGPLGRPRRGVGQLALTNGATVVPVAITRTARRFAPGRVRVNVGAPLVFPATGEPTTVDAIRLATDRIWAAVTGEWEALPAARPSRAS
jgi:1-acyl-sn-glycerol-3-phosphate acyltransferase